MTRNKLLNLSLLLAVAVPGAAFAQTAYLQQSGIVGEGKTISINRLPVVSSTGAITYYNGAVNLTFNANGAPVLGGHVFTQAPMSATDGFIAGRYYVKAGTCATQFADVTYGVGSGGSTIWSLVLETPASCGGAYPNQATWQTGAPAPDVAARLASAKTPINPNYSYGLTDINGGSGVGNFNNSNGLLAASQISGGLELISYTDGYNHDQPEQQGSIFFDLCADATCSNAPK